MIKNLPKSINPELIILISALVWYILTAWFSTGYYHADEHYQIIEFSGIKTSGYSSYDLTWEYTSQIRPALQPAIATVIFNVAEAVKISSPFAKAFLLRLITALLAFLIITHFTRSVKPLLLSKYWFPFLFFSYFLWFLPMLNCRFSSETWSGFFLLLAVSTVIRGKLQNTKLFIVGLLIGLAFNFRFQIGFAAIGLIFWMILFRQTGWRTMYLFLGGILMLLLGVIIDYWFYNKWVFTPWNYYQQNVVNDIMLEFGTSPWYYYVYFIFRYAFFPFGIVILVSFLALIFKSPRNIITWLVLPFIVIHSLFGHKELRFLFPVANFIPFIFFSCLANVK